MELNEWYKVETDTCPVDRDLMVRMKAPGFSAPTNPIRAHAVNWRNLRENGGSYRVEQPVTCESCGDPFAPYPESPTQFQGARRFVAFKGWPAERDPDGRDAHSPGAKLDAGKPLPWLFLSGFARALQAVTEVTTKGARKYTPNGWVDVPDGEQRYMEAFGRHLLALGQGERVDAETECLHKAQMVWNLLASLELELRKEAKP